MASLSAARATPGAGGPANAVRAQRREQTQQWRFSRQRDRTRTSRATAIAGYRVHRYELDAGLPPGPEPAGRARPRLNAIAGRAPLAEFQLNLADFRIGRVRVDGRPPHYTHRGGKLRDPPGEAAARRGRVHRRGALVGQPQAGAAAPGAGSAGRSWRTGRWWRASRSGRRPGTRATTGPPTRPSYQISVTTPSAYAVVAGGRLLTRTTKASTTTWVYEQSAPTSSYLVGLSDRQVPDGAARRPGPGRRAAARAHPGAPAAASSPGTSRGSPR